MKKGARINDCTFNNTDLSGNSYICVDFEWTRFHRVTLVGADFRGSNLEHAYFNFADLKGVDFRGANLGDVIFHNCDLTNAKFYNAIINWNSSELVAQLILNTKDQSADIRVIAGYFLLSGYRLWNDIYTVHLPRKKLDEVLNILATYVKEGDNAPNFLKIRHNDLR